MSEEFRLVTRKKWIARRSLRTPAPNCVPLAGARQQQDCVSDEDLEKFIKRLEKLCERMETSDFFLAAMDTLKEGLNELKTPQQIAQLDHFVCFGLGQFMLHSPALHQFAFALCMQRYCKLEKAVYYDPVFSKSEKQILQKLKCSVMSENCLGSYAIEKPTLFFMPHVPHFLADNLLRANWKPELLPHIVLIQNSFQDTVSSSPSSLVIKKSIAYIKEYAIEDYYRVKNIFNDLSFHFFTQRLPDMQHELWLLPPSVAEVAPQEALAADLTKMCL